MNPFCRCLLIGLALGSVVLPCSTACADEAPTRIFVVDDSKPPASTRWKLVGGGLLASASFYGAALPFALQWPDAPGVKDLRAPVVGPWLALAHNGCAADDTDCSTAWRVVRGLFEILDGLGQAGGLGIALEGMFLPTGPESTTQRPGAPRTVPSPNGEPAPSNEPRNLFYLPRPIVVGKQGVGFGVAGVF